MLHARLTVNAHDPINVIRPKNGKRSWLRVQFGSTAHELWIPVGVAQQLHAQLSARLTELDADNAGTPAKE